jgi:hypothetical protein
LNPPAKLVASFVVFLCLLLVVGAGPGKISAEPVNPYFRVETVMLSDGTQLERMTISGPPSPPPGYEHERAAVAPLAPSEMMAAASLPVPAYNWVFGCSAVSGSMIGAYFDRNGLPNIYTGPTNGGVMPMDNSVWGYWTDGTGDAYPNNPLTASHLGTDGRTTKGSIDDYWVAYGSSAADPYITGDWSQHPWSDAFGDYMKTSQSAWDNTDGATTFWGYLSGSKLTCASLESGGYLDDGTLGRKQFYAARGYPVPAEECYNQKIDVLAVGGFSFAQYKAKIDAGYPVFLNLAGHSVVGVGYADPNTVYINDTWDYSTHSMTWGGSYAGMSMQSVSVADPASSSPTPAISINDVSVTEGNSGTLNAGFTVSLSAPAPGAVSVAWATADGTAIAGSDYVAASGTVNFTAGQSSQPVTVQVIGDTVVESNETFSVNLSNPSGATIADGQGIGTILNNDQPPATVHVGDLDRAVSIQKKAGTWTATVTITAHDAVHKIVTGAAVSANWSSGAGGGCTTSRKGTCTISLAGIPSGTSSVTLTVTHLAVAGYTYQSAANHDPDSNDESNGTTITVRK